MEGDARTITHLEARMLKREQLQADCPKKGINDRTRYNGRE